MPDDDTGLGRSASSARVDMAREAVRSRSGSQCAGETNAAPCGQLAAASRSSSARLLLCAAVFSWPHAASMSRPRGVRTGAEIPASNTILLNDLIRSGVEHSYGAPGQGLNGIRLTFAGSRYLRISR